MQLFGLKGWTDVWKLEMVQGRVDKYVRYAAFHNYTSSVLVMHEVIGWDHPCGTWVKN